MTPPLRPMEDVATELGLDPLRLVPYGRHKAKVELGAGAPREGDRSPGGRLVLVSAVTPTRSGEGKTTVSVGLADGLRRLDRKSTRLNSSHVKSSYAVFCLK